MILIKSDVWSKVVDLSGRDLEAMKTDLDLL